MIEAWKDIQGYEGIYKVSNLGNIKSLDRKRINHSGGNAKIKGKIIKLMSDKDGYYRISLRKNGLKNGSVHRLTAAAFIPNPDNKPMINHKDGNKHNNFVDLENTENSNLEWCTHAENEKHALDNGLKARGKKNGNVILKLSQVKKIKKSLLKGLGITELGRIYGVSKHVIFDIKRRKSWKWVNI